MKIIFVITLVLFTVNLFAQNPDLVLKKDHKIDSSKVILPDDFYKREGQIIIQLLNNYSYKKHIFTDSLSSVIFDEYIKSLDITRSYFLASDIQSLEKYRFQFDDFIKQGSLDIPFEIFNLFKKRMGERITFVTKCLQSEFDFSVNETYTPDRSKAAWAKDENELDEIWRLRSKNEALQLVLSGKDAKKVNPDLLKRYQNSHKAILQYDAEDVFSIYMNSITQSFDPHTDYFSPAASDAFSISMKLSLEGIGAQLRQEGDYTVVANIVPGGPAMKSNLLHEGDKIVGVAQGEAGEFVDVIGWRLDDAIQLIRGKKGTTVRMQIIKKEDGDNAAAKEVSIMRDQIKLEEQAAKSEILNLDYEGKNFKLGVVKLPSFYTDFEGQRTGKLDYKSTTRDVKEIIKKFKEEKVDGMIMDLRENGGGSLAEAITLTGLFIKEGPVVQVKDARDNVEVDIDPDPAIVYDGPFAVLIDRYSASASEIFSAAIQDYGRGVVIGEKTYGKGTVQNILDLSMFLRSEGKKAGQLKMTQAKFYRITGSSTQRKGVTPDLVFPTAKGAEDYSESSRPSSLPWDQIASSQYVPYQNVFKVFPLLKKKHEERAKNDPEYQLMLDEIKEYDEARNQKEFSLNKEVRKAEREQAEARRKKRDEERAKLLGIKIEEKKEVQTPNNSQSDYELKESGRILADLILAKVG